MTYYDIDDIIADEHWLTINMKQDIYRGGFLDTEFGRPNEDLLEGQKVRVPFWVARPLYAMENEVCTVDVPPMFSDGF